MKAGLESLSAESVNIIGNVKMANGNQPINLSQCRRESGNDKSWLSVSVRRNLCNTLKVRNGGIWRKLAKRKYRPTMAI